MARAMGDTLVPDRRKTGAVVMHTIGQIDDGERGFDVLAADRISRAWSAAAEAPRLKRREPGMRLYIWKIKPTWRARHWVSFVPRHVRDLGRHCIFL